MAVAVEPLPASALEPIFSHDELSGDELDAEGMPRPRRAKTPQEPTGPPLVHLGYEGARHQHPERLPSARRRDNTVSLRLFDLQPQSIASLLHIAPYLRRVSFCGLHLKTIREGWVKDLANLDKLDVSHNRLGDNAIPECVRNCDYLSEVIANGNVFTTVPVAFRKLKNLRRLNMAQNGISSITGLDKARKLQVLIMDDNQVASCIRDISFLKRLETLHLNRNGLKEIPSDIRHLKGLRDFRVSGNELGTLPAELFLLPAIDFIDASKNLIVKIPSLNVKGRAKRRLQLIDISDNQLARLPEFMLYLTDKLDVSYNRIKTIKGHVIKKLPWGEDHQELLLRGNPISTPPLEVAESGLKAMVHFFIDEMAQTRVYQGLKLICLGGEGVGKTSLVQSFVDEQPRPAENPTLWLDLHEHVLEVPLVTDDADPDDEPQKAPLHLSIFDLGGHPFYDYPNTMFIEQPALALFVFNMSTFTPERFYEEIGYYVTLFAAKTNTITGILVGTHRDKLTVVRTAEVVREAMECFEKFVKDRKQMIENQMKAIEARSVIPLSMQEQLKSLVPVLDMKPMVYEKVISLSSVNYEGVIDLRAAVETMATRRKLFPSCMKPVPSLWLDVENFIETKGEIMPMPVLPWSEYEAQVTAKCGMKHLLPKITQYLHDTGKVIYKPEKNGVPAVVVLRPTFFVDIFRQIFRHDMVENLDFNQEENFLSLGFGINRFEACKRDYHQEGFLDRDFVKGLAANALPLEYGQYLNEVINILCTKDEYAYPVNKLQGSLNFDFPKPPEDADPSKPQKTPVYPRVLVPLYRNVSEPETARELWDTLEDAISVNILFQFHQFYPPGLFERLAVRAHAEAKGLTYRFHWKTGVLAQHVENKILVLLRLQERSSSHDEAAIFVQVRDEGLGEPTDDEKKQAAEAEEFAGLGDISFDDSRKPHRRLWATLLPLINDLESAIREYSGLRLKRFTRCPTCREFSFNGEWLTPKDFQGAPVKMCEACEQPQSTQLLVQPKDKHKVDIMKLLKAREEQKKAEAEEEAKQIPEALFAPPEVPAVLTIEKVEKPAKEVSRRESRKHIKKEVSIELDSKAGGGEEGGKVNKPPKKRRESRRSVVMPHGAPR